MYLIDWPLLTTPERTEFERERAKEKGKRLPASP
jgi:hypothetical protein